MAIVCVGDRPSRDNAQRLAWVSIVLGVGEITFAKQLDRFLGTGNGKNSGVIRVLGVREVMQGLDLFSHSNKKPGIIARVIGDALDSTLLTIAMQQSKKLPRVVLATLLLAPVVLTDLREALRPGSGI